MTGRHHRKDRFVMSTRALTIAALSSLLLAVGCAATTPEEGEDSESAAAPAVETDSLGPEATSQTCSCPAGKEYQNGLCYTKCAAGWSGEGPVCWQPCAVGFTDTGFFCNREGKIIGADTSSCPWYNKCGVGSDCNKCPSGYSNDGCTCRIDPYIYAQPSYGRGDSLVLDAVTRRWPSRCASRSESSASAAQRRGGQTGWGPRIL